MDLTEDEHNMLAAHAAAAKIRHLTPAQLAQVDYELKQKGLIVEGGCCGKRDLTQRAIDVLWEDYRNQRG